MPAKRSPLTCYPDEIVEQQFQSKVRPYYVGRNEGVRVTDSYILRELIREKFYDIINEQTRSLTIRKVYEEVVSLRGSINDMREYFVDEGMKMFEERLTAIERQLDFFVDGVRPKRGLVEVRDMLVRIEEKLAAKEESDVR